MCLVTKKALQTGKIELELTKAYGVAYTHCHDCDDSQCWPRV